ncbi:MAG: hypothetical protein ACYS7Y_35200 [Planctomycetota bacterium]|jgi:hypothetical protein
MFELNLTPDIVMRDKRDGTGFEVCAGTRNRAQLQIGNVSVAFDDHNDWVAEDGFTGLNLVMSENRDDPVRLNGTSVHDVSDPADKLLFALAADRGFRLEKIER